MPGERLERSINPECVCFGIPMVLNGLILRAIESFTDACNELELNFTDLVREKFRT